MPFSGVATSKRKFFNKILMVAYVHIQYSTYQFLGELKGVVWPLPPPPLLVVGSLRHLLSYHAVPSWCV